MFFRPPDSWLVGLQIFCGCVLLATGFLALALRWPGLSLPGSLVLGFGAMLLGAILLGPILSTWFAEPVGRLFFPEERYDQVQPLYSVAEAKVAKEAFEEAMTFYAHIAEQHPKDLKPYVDRIRICVVHLHDPARAERVLQEGREALHDPESRERLEAMYQAISSLAEAPADWNRARTLSLERDE